MANKKKETPHQRRLILGNGELLAKEVNPQKNPFPPKALRTYDEARTLVLSELNTSLERLEDLPCRLYREDELVYSQH